MFPRTPPWFFMYILSLLLLTSTPFVQTTTTSRLTTKFATTLMNTDEHHGSTPSGLHDNGTDPEGHDEGHGSHGISLVPVHFEHVKYPVVFSIVVILAGMSKLGFHFSHFLSSKVPESW